MIKNRGITYKTTAQINDEIARIEREIEIHGETDELAVALWTMQDTLAAFQTLQAERAAEIRASRYEGDMVTSSTGTTHFVNGWDETYCGRDGSTMGYGLTRHGRASCATCCKAADSVTASGAHAAGGSPARRG